jgi:transcriptional regulator with XRE-family HTH domain
MGKKKKKEKLKHRPLALRLAEHRLARDWSQAELAERMDSSDVTIGRIEGGKQNWNQEFLQEAASVLGVAWLDLLPLPGTGTILDIWADIPPNERGRALAALRIFSRKSAA